jgi:GT2 family glycosyltransferase/glycosyltransferase involved in cell wall biosynthesis
MDQDVKYWMQNETVQNFGDFLSQYFMQHLFFAQPDQGQDLRIIGSCIDDMFVPEAPDGADAVTHVFWGCGLREEGGLSQDRRARTEILAVRGPLTRSALRLGGSVPFGDPGLLLPALHKAAMLGGPSGRALLVPHFHDRRPDAELLALTGCDEVLRPNIARDLDAVTEFIERLACADFVLSGAMHGAITAAAYGRPFAFWDSGNIDLPFKWRDFAASLGIDCAFQPTLEAARAHYETAIAPRVSLPVLWPLLVAAPLPVRPDAFVSVVALDVARHGPAALSAKVSSRAASRLQGILQHLAAEAGDATVLRADLARRIEGEQVLSERVALLAAAEQRMAGELAERAAREGQMLATLAQSHGDAAELRNHLAQLRQESEALREQAAELGATGQAMAERAASLALAEAQALADAEAARAELASLRQEMAEQAQAAAARAVSAHEAPARRDARARRRPAATAASGERDSEIVRLEAREAWLAEEEARLHRAVQDRDIALAAAQAALAAEQARVAALPARGLVVPVLPLPRLPRLPRRRLGRAARLAWLAATFRLGRHLRERRRVLGEIAMLAASPLLDAAWYARENPGVAAGAEAAARHYVFSGAAAGLAPNPMFDGAWYRRTCPDSARSPATPLAHYLSHGAAAGHDPHPLFDTAWYAAHTPGAPAGAGALAHYLTQGAPAGAAPNALFHVAGYLCEYRDVREAGLDPVQHYLREGAAQGRDPHPLFDTDFYLATYPDAAASGMNPLAHYLRHGRAAGHLCNALAGAMPGLDIGATLRLPSWDAPEASVVIPAYRHFHDTLRCLHALAAHSGDTVGFETIVIDDDPANPIAPLLQGTPGLRVLSNAENLGFLRSCNRAAAQARGWHIVFLNNDTLVRPDWLAPLLELVRGDPQVGMVGCKLLEADGTVQEAGGIVFEDGWGYAFGRGDDPAKPEYNYVREVDVVTGAAFLVRRDLFASLGGFDDRYAPAFYEEFDLAFEVRRAGFTVMYQPRSEVVHLGSSSYGAETRDRQSRHNHAQFCLKWEDVLQAQPERDESLLLARQRGGAAGIVLMIDDKVPEYDRHAGALTVFQYIGLLRRLGLRVVFAPADGVARAPYIGTLQAMGIEVLTAPTRLDAWLEAHGDKLLAVWTARPDVTAPLLGLLHATTDAPILYYPHDLHYLRERRRYELDGDLDALAESHRVKRLERDIFARVDCVMTPSAEEAPIIARLVPESRVRVVPPYLYPAGSAMALNADDFAMRHDILFVGGFKHPPNVDAALWLVGEIMPIVWAARPEARVLIVGDTPTPAVESLASDRVTVTGFVPDLQPYLDRARLSVAPLRWGAGVKGKIVSAVQAGIPVVTTQVGNEGIALARDTEVLLGETAEALAEHIVSLLGDEVRCEALSRAGAAAVGARFSERLARDVMSEIMGVDLCHVCGTLRTRLVAGDGKLPAREAAGEPVCETCAASASDQAVAQAVIHCVGWRGPEHLRAALPALRRKRMHVAMSCPPVTVAMADCPLLTTLDDFATEPGVNGEPPPFERLPFRDGELDVLVAPAEWADRRPEREDVLRVVKPGGAVLIPTVMAQSGT